MSDCTCMEMPCSCYVVRIIAERVATAPGWEKAALLDAFVGPACLERLP